LIKITKAKELAQNNQCDKNKESTVVKQNKVGEVFTDDKNKLLVQTDRGILVIEKLQLEGRKEITSAEFLRGYPNIISTILS